MTPATYLIVFGGRTPAPPETPEDLAEAIKDRFLANRAPLGSLTAIYADQAGDRAVLPYLCYSITAGPDYFTSDTSYYFDQSVMFKAYATTQDEANALRESVAAVFGVGSYDYQAGFSIPFFQKNRSQAKEPNRSVMAGYVFRASIQYSARCSRGS